MGGVSVEACDLEPTVTNLERVTFTDAATTALKRTYTAALRLGHNYIGTEHILLGIVSSDNPAAEALCTLGLSPSAIESAITDAVAFN